MAPQDEPHIQVKSEDESDRVLLQTKIIKDDGYQKQQGMCGVDDSEMGGLWAWLRRMDD